MILSTQIAKIALLLGIVAALSIAGNAYMIYRAGVVSAEHAGAIEKARLQGALDAKAEAQATSEQLAKDAVEDYAKMVSDFERIAERARQTRIVYKEVAAAAPLPEGCAPGSERTTAVNSALEK